MPLLLTKCVIIPQKTQHQASTCIPVNGLPGDNLNLYAVLKLFQESATLEDFEKSLNEKQDVAVFTVEKDDKNRHHLLGQRSNLQEDQL